MSGLNYQMTKKGRKWCKLTGRFQVFMGQRGFIPRRVSDGIIMMFFKYPKRRMIHYLDFITEVDSNYKKVDVALKKLCKKGYIKQVD